MPRGGSSVRDRCSQTAAWPAKGPHSGELEHKMRKEKAGGAGFVQERMPRGHLITVCSYLKKSCRED